jgi:hypothetical protein
MKKKHIYRKRLAKMLKQTFKELDSDSLKSFSADEVRDYLDKMFIKLN